MDSERPLIETLATFRRRLRLVHAFGRLHSWSLAAAVLTLLLVIQGKLLYWSQAELLTALLTFPLFCFGSALARWFSPPDLLATARAVDRELQSKERVLTAADWVLREKPATGISTWLLRDAEKHLSETTPDQLFKLRLSWNRWALVLILVASGLCFTAPWEFFEPPNPPQQIRLNRSAERLEELAERLEKKKDGQKLAKQLRELAQQMREPGVTPQEAASKLAQTRRQLANEQDSKPAVDRAGLERLQQKVQRAKSSQATREALEQMKKAAGQQAENSPVQKALEEARRLMEEGKPEEAREAMQKAAQELGEQLDQQETMEQLEQELAQQQGELDPDQLAQGEGKGVGQMPNPGPEGKVGEGPADFGRGTTNEEETGQGDGQGRLVSRQSDRTSDWTEEFEKLHQAQRFEVRTGDTKVKGQIQKQGGFLKTPGEVRSGVGSPARVQTGAEEVYLRYRREAEQAVAQEHIPAQYRETVQDYFTEIDPRR